MHACAREYRCALQRLHTGDASASDSYENGDGKRRDRAEMHTHKWLLTGWSLTRRIKSAVTFCLHFLGNTQRCMFRIPMHQANSGSLMICVVFIYIYIYMDSKQAMALKVVSREQELFVDIILFTGCLYL